MKIGQAQERDFWVYVNWRWCEADPVFNPFPVKYPPDGDLSALEAFTLIEAKGEWPGTNQRLLLATALNGKKLLNWQIKQWASGLSEVPLPELQSDFPQLPEWVWRAVSRQARAT